MRHIIGKTFEGMERFSLADLEKIKKEIRSTKMTMKGFRKVLDWVLDKHAVNKQTAFNATQYCIINRNS